MAPRLRFSTQEQLENTVAASIEIATAVKALVYQTDAFDSLALLLAILRAAALIRRNVLDISRSLKGETTVNDMQTPDPYAAALDAHEASIASDIYGQFDIDVWFCVLQKGVGKVPFDPQQHAPAQRRTAIDINLQDLGGNNYTRSFIGEIGTDGWLKVTLPSLKAIGVTDLRGVSGKYVHAVMTPFGKYTDKEGNEKQRTAPAIKAIYPDQAACEKAAQAAQGGTGPDWLVGDAPAAAANGSAAANGASAQGNDPERATAAQFLKPFAAMAREGNGVNSAKLQGFIDGNPLLKKHFTLASPEVAQAIEQALAEPAF